MLDPNLLRTEPTFRPVATKTTTLKSAAGVRRASSILTSAIT